MFRTMVTFDNEQSRYSRGPYLAVTRNTSGHYVLQWYWTDGHGGARYNPPVNGKSFARRRDAEAEKRRMRESGDLATWIDRMPKARAEYLGKPGSR